MKMDTESISADNDTVLEVNQSALANKEENIKNGTIQNDGSNTCLYKRLRKEADIDIAELSDEDLAEFLRDKTFVDFFNVYLSLPIFPQRLIYKFEEKDFDFDPPLRKAQFIVDRRKLVAWVVKARFVPFLDTDLFLEYILCKELLTLRPTLSPSAHDLDYDSHRKIEDSSFLEECIGHVVGMCTFRTYIGEGPGEKVYRCLMDLKRFNRLDKTDHKIRWLKYRELQVMYFRTANKEERHRDIWKDIADGTHFVGPPLLGGTDPLFGDNQFPDMKPNTRRGIDKILDARGPITEEEIGNKRLEHLHQLLLAVLKDYWLQKYVIHCRALKLKKEKSRKSSIKMKSPSDLAILKDVKNIDKAMANIQGHLGKSIQVKSMKAKLNWKAMFPENQVDDSFLNSNEDIVTIHEEGVISVNPINSDTFEQMMQRYVSSDSDSGQELSDTCPDQLLSNKGSDLSRNLSLAMAKRTASKLKRKSSSDVVLQKIQRTEQDALAAKVTKSNLALFENMLDLNFETIPRTDEKAKEQSLPAVGRPDSCPLGPSVSRTPGSSKNRRDKSSTNNKRSAQVDPLWQVGVKRTNSTHHPDKFTSLGLLSVVPEDVLSSQPPQPALLEEISLQKTHESAVISTPSYRYQNLCQGYYRHDNRHFINSIAADVLGGHPFQRYLHQHQLVDHCKVMSFWRSAQEYLSTKGSEKQNLGDYIKFRRAKAFLLRYIGNIGDMRVNCLPPGLVLTLQRFLPRGKGDDLLRDAQDMALEIHRRSSRCLSPVARSSSVPPWAGVRTSKMRDSVLKEEELTEEEVKAEVSKVLEEHLPDENSDGSRRQTLALQLTMFLADMYDQGLPIEPIDLNKDDLCYDQSYGSLALKNLVVLERRDLIEERNRQEKVNDRARAAHRDALDRTSRAGVAKIEMKVEDDIPAYKKPFKRAGQWYYRPSKPRSFAETLKDPSHVEFFRRFLMCHGSETPLLFYLAVEEMKNCKDAKTRQQKINQITRRYFNGTTGRGIEALQCNADVVKEIPKMDRVAPAMLVSAQSCVVRSMEDKWATVYIETFDDSPSKAVLTDALDMFEDAGKRSWGKERTRHLWISFVRSVVRFRRAILTPHSAKLFNEFLRSEAKAEIDKQRSVGQAIVPGVPVKKIIRNKLIDVTKLCNDAAFLAEAERYRTMCDDATSAARSGSYSIHDQSTLEMKAKTIIDCFIDSELPPKIQINVTQEQAESIMETYKNNILERGLFHHATISIFPVMASYWKKFQTFRISTMFLKPENKSGNPVTSTGRSTPDYMNMGTVKTKKVTTHHDDDHPHMLFSLVHGARILLPAPREHHSHHATDDLGFRRNTVFPMGGLFYPAGSNHGLSAPDDTYLGLERRDTMVRMTGSSRRVSVIRAPTRQTRLNTFAELPAIPSGSRASRVFSRQQPTH